MARIELTDICKVYHKQRIEIPVLTDLSLTVESGEFTALMGPSGSGKTTLLNLIGGLDKPTRGRVVLGEDRLDTMNPNELTTWRSRNVGFIFQLHHLVPVLTAAQNVELPLLLFKLSRAERRLRVDTALDIVDLRHRADHRPNQLSGGEEQRAAIARAIVTDPKVILADEPTGDLDKANAEETLKLLETLNRALDKTVVMVTHDPHAAEHARRVHHLEKGQLIEAESHAPSVGATG